MFIRVKIIILLVSIEYLLAAENSSTAQSLQLPDALSTPFGNTTTQETEANEVQNASNDVTENLLVISNNSNQLHQESQNIEQKQINYNFLRPRGKTKFIFENIVHASSNTEAPSSTKTKTQDQRPNVSVNLQLGEIQRQQLQLATVEKEEFIQSELHNLAKDIAETELNLDAAAGKTDTNPRPSSWKSFFSNIFPQGILNVFHLSVAGVEPQKSKELPTSVQVNRIINPNDTYQNKIVITERPTSPITLPMTPPLPPAPPLSETPPSIPIIESVPTITLETLSNEENKNGTLMTNKDVFDINSAAEVSELPFSEPVIPMESRNIFHIHPFNCNDNCGDESEDYVDQLSETGDDNVVAFSREAPNNIFYPTPKPLPYDDFRTIRNTDIFYSGTGTQTSEEIIRENTKDFGQKLPYHPAKQLDDFQKEVEKQFDHNEVRIDSEAASRKFLKHFKGKFIRPQQSNSEIQSSTFKAPNHFELIASTLRPDINFQSQPSPIKPESQLHTYIFSAGFNSNSANTEPSKLEASKYTTFKEQPRNGKADNTNYLQGPIVGEKSLKSENLSLPYPSVKPENLLRAYLFTSNNNNNSVLNAGLKSAAVISSWIAPNKNSDTKENVKIIPNQIKLGNRLNTNIYSASPYGDEGTQIVVENVNENNVQGQIKDEESLNSNAAYKVYSPNLKPESLLHTYIFSKYDNNNESVTNAESEGTPKPEDVFSTYSTPKPGQSGQGLSSFRPTQITYLCTNDQLKNGDCSYSTTTPSPDSFYQQKDLIQIQKSLEQPVKHTKPYVYYNFPAGPTLLSKNPIRVEQQPTAEDSQLSESFVIPESYQQRQQYLQDQQQQLNQQQEHFQQKQIQQYQQKLQYQQQQQYQQKQREEMQKQQEQLQQYQQKQQQQLKQYQQVQQQQRDQQQQQLQQQQMQHQQQLKQFQQVQQQQRDQQQLQKQQQQLQQYQQEQQTQRDQQQLLQMQNQQKDQQQKQQQKQPQEHHQQHYEKEKKLIHYNTVQVEKIVPKPYPVHIKEIVEKIVDRPVPVERIVEKPINVPYPVREVVEKIIDRPYPVEKIIDRPVHIPYPVQVDHFIDRPYAVRVPVAVAVPVPVHQYIDRPYPVEKIIEKPIHVPYPVDKVVEKIIEKHIPIEVERIVEKPAAPPKKPASKKHPKKPEPYSYSAVDEYTNKSKTNLEEELLELVPPPVDQEDHDSYKTIPDDVEFILLDDYNGPVPLDHQAGYPWNQPEKRATKNHNIKRSPEFRRNLRVEYGFRPPLIPSIEIGSEKGFI